jgi:GNAT superfamily N-acetyltransferase
VIRVERLGADRWESYRQVRLAALADSPEAYASTLEREQAFDETTWRSRLSENGTFLATRHGVVAGTATGFCPGEQSSPGEQGGATGGDRLLVAMWVLPDHRGTGVAQALVEAVVDWAREDGGVRVLLAVVDTNKVARRLYERLGFALTGHAEPLARDPRRSELEMQLRLSAGAVAGTAE